MTTDDINIIHCSIDDVGKCLPELPVYIICDRNVKDIALKTGVKPRATLEIEASENNKTISTIEKINRWLMDNGADRNALILGIGGGITTDMVGFAASVYKRGVRFAFLPTTLLSQVDAAIGGKNGVNLDSYKNIIGVFRQPEATFICHEALRGLPFSELVSGSAELLKTFIIKNKDKNYEKAVRLFSSMDPSKDDALMEHSGILGDLVTQAAKVKAWIAGHDPQEKGERMVLNLGHTFAHAIEKLSEEKISHGQAVAMGIILAAKLSERLGTAKHGFCARLESDFRACGLETDCPFPIHDLAVAMTKDKKAESGIIHFILPLRIGRVEIRDIRPEDVVRLLEN